MKLLNTIGWIALAALVLIGSASAQSGYTSVTATVTDVSGNPYAGGRYQITFVYQGASGNKPLLSGSVFQQQVSGSLDSSGKLAVSLADNNSVTPAPSQWNFQICAASGAPCFSALLTITGSSQDISSALTAVAPPLHAFSGGTVFGGITATGLIQAQSIEQVRYADQFPGADIGAKINAADASLGTQAGEIWVTQAGTISTAVTLTANHTLRLKAATTWQAPLTLAAGDSIIGSGAAAVMTAQFASAPTASQPIFSGSGISDVRIEGVWMVGANGTNVYQLLSCSACNHVLVRGNYVSNAQLVTTDSSATAPVGSGNDKYTNVTDANSSHNVIITGNVAIGAVQASPGAAAILAQYTRRATIAGNVIEGFLHGIEWWGGDACQAGCTTESGSGDGAIGNARLAQDLSITGNAVYNVGGGGIWGSMGQGVVIAGNDVNTCGDVCIDAEGSFDVAVTGNRVAGGVNGDLTTFSAVKSYVATGNELEQSIATQPVVKIYNSPVGASNVLDATFRANSMICTATTPCVADLSQAVDRLTFSGNHLRDVMLNANGGNHHVEYIADNDLLFDVACTSACDALQVGGYNSLSGESGYAFVSGNNIDSLIAQPSGSIALSVLNGDFNADDVAIVEANDTVGSHPFGTDVELTSNTANSGITPYFLVRHNVLGSSTITKSNTGSGGLNAALVQNFVSGGAEWAGDDPWNPSSVASSYKVGSATINRPTTSGTEALTSQLPISATTASIGGSALAAGTCATGNVAVASSTTAMAVAVSPAADPGTGFTWEAWVSAAGTVTVRLCNITAGSLTPTAEAYNVRVVQ